jgi:hypothetical protein
VRGNILLNNSGLVILEAGDYQATIEAVFYGNETGDGCEFNLFLAVDGYFDATLRNIVGSSNTVAPGQVVQFQSTSIVHDLNYAQFVTLVMNNGCTSDPVSTKMFAWGISLLKV